MASMLSLLDVLPRHERVDIGGGDAVDVFGVSSEDVGKILARFPNAFAQIADSQGNVAMMDPGLLGAVIAASMRTESFDSLIGDQVAEKIARSYGVGVQMKLVQAIGRCTFPDGIGPFLEGLASISSGAKEALRVVVRVASKDQAMRSQPTQRPLDAPNTHPSGN